MKRAAAAGFGILLVQIYSDIGKVVPNSPRDFGSGDVFELRVAFQFSHRSKQ